MNASSASKKLTLIQATSSSQKPPVETVQRAGIDLRSARTDEAQQPGATSDQRTRGEQGSAIDGRRARRGRAGCALGEGLAEPVERDGERDDRDAGLEAGADVEPAQRGEHVEAEAAGADHRGDDHHVERQHDHLVDADHQPRAGRTGTMHLPDQLARRAADHPAEVDDLVRHAAQRQRW